MTTKEKLELHRKIREILDKEIHTYKADKLLELIEKELSSQRESFKEMVEGMRPETCDCVGEKYNCEHWGRHEMADELLQKLT